MKGPRRLPDKLVAALPCAKQGQHSVFDAKPQEQHATPDVSAASLE